MAEVLSIPLARSSLRRRRSINNHIAHITHMTNITLSVPEKTYKRMKRHPELKWSEIARQSIEAKLKEIEEAPWRAYDIKRLAEGEDAHELFKF